MTSVPLGDIAQLTASDFARKAGRSLSPSSTAELASAIELALLTAVRAERRACAAAESGRGRVWLSKEGMDNSAASLTCLNSQGPRKFPQC